MWRDPLVSSSISVGALGAVSAIDGALVWQLRSRQAYCGELGCVSKPVADDRADIGRTFTGVGVGLAVAGAVGMGATLGAPLQEGEERDGPAAATVGYLMTSLSAGFFGGALALGPDTNRPNGWERTAPLFVASGVFAAVGIPLFVVGAGREDQAERDEEARDEAAKQLERRRARERQAAIDRGEIQTEMRSPVALGAGIVLMAAGTGGAIACGVLGSQVKTGGFLSFEGFSVINYAIGGAVSASAGLGAGIPLVVFGAKQVPVEEDGPKKKARVSIEPTRLSVGAGTASAEWAF